MEQTKTQPRPTRAHPLTSQRAIRGMSPEVAEKLMAGPPQMGMAERRRRLHR